MKWFKRSCSKSYVNTFFFRFVTKYKSERNMNVDKTEICLKHNSIIVYKMLAIGCLASIGSLYASTWHSASLPFPLDRIFSSKSTKFFEQSKL